MTTKISPTPTVPTAAQSRTGFQPIPTRIRDLRGDANVPPLVVDGIAGEQKAAVEQTLGELSSRLAEVHRTAAEAYLSQGSYESALPHLEAAATFAPGEPEYLHQAGFVRYITGDDAGAIAAFEAVLSNDANNGDAWFNLAMVLFGQSRFAEAESCFAKAIEQGPNDAQTWNNRGVCLWQLQRIEDARTCFQRALQIDPRDDDARFNLSSIR